MFVDQITQFKVIITQFKVIITQSNDQGPDLYAFIGFIGFIGPDDINYMC